MHGGDIYRQRVDLDYSVCLNPLGMPPEAVSACVRLLAEEQHYPDIRCGELRNLLSERLSRNGRRIPPEQILAGNGACELIYLLVSETAEERRKAGFPSTSVLVPSPGFSEYAAAARAAGCGVRYLELKEEEGYRYPDHMEDFLGEDTGLVFLCSPNNPAGTVPDLSEMRRLAAVCRERGVRLCVDESFLPFSEKEEELTALSLAASCPEVSVLRAFTKIYAMAGLRLGFLVTGSADVTEKLRGKLQPWNVSAAAQAAGCAALRADGRYLAKTRRLVASEKEWMKARLLENGAEILGAGEGCFLLFRAREDLKEKLLEKRILIRDFEESEGLPRGVFRIGIRNRAENRKFVRILEDICKCGRTDDAS